jgi:hypothetical protein
MRKPFCFFTTAKAVSAAALFVVVAGCSETTAPLTARGLASHASAAASEEPQASSAPIAVFVIGDAEASDVGTTVNFWGAQWWMNNQMSGVVSEGVASFKGYATTSDNVCGGIWQSLPGNSYDPPDTLATDIAVIVTSTVVKDGAVIRGDIKKIVMVHHDGGYGPNPGHDGNGVVTTTVLCGGNDDT